MQERENSNGTLKRVCAEISFRVIATGHRMDLLMFVEYVGMDCVKAFDGPKRHAYLFNHMFCNFALLACDGLL